VIAHELAHVGNGDTRLMMLVVAGIGLFTFLGEKLSTVALGSCASHMPDEDSIHGDAMLGPLMVIPLFFSIICLIFGYLIAPIIRFALSRRREFQADATAAKIIRDPDALVRALAKIAPDSKVNTIDRCPLVGNLCIAKPTRAEGVESKLFATHPPIEERIAALKNMVGKNVIPPVPAGKAIW